MILFWLICVGLVAIALAFILPTLLERGEMVQVKGEGGRKEANLAVYRDQLAELSRDLENGLIGREQHDEDRDELERRLLEDVSTTETVSSRHSRQLKERRNYVFAIAIAIPLLAVALYLRLGNLKAMSASLMPRQQASAPATPQTGGQRSQEQIEANVAALAKRLEEKPDDPQGWAMLGRSYMSLGKYSEASAAYVKASALKPNDADLLAETAFAIAMANGQRYQGQPSELIDKALKVDPQNAKALQLAGSAAFEAKDYKRALDYWQKLLAKLPPGSDVEKELSDRIEETKKLSGSGR